MFLAQDNNVFSAELAPVTIKVKRADVSVDVDEHPKPKTTLETLAKLPTVFKKDGVVTAGSASVSILCNIITYKTITEYYNIIYTKQISIFLNQGICDGAGAVILASEEALKEHSLTPLARLVGYSVVGVDPSIMGIGPSPSISKLLSLAGKTLNDIDLVEVI